MTTINLILIVLAASVGAGGVAAYFKKGEGKATIELLKTQIASYKDTEARLIAEAKAMTADNLSKDKLIAEQRNTIKAMVREFKEYKDGKS
jgi:hypothetical protein